MEKFIFTLRDATTNDIKVVSFEGKSALDALQREYPKEEYYIQETSPECFRVVWDWGDTYYLSVHHPEKTKLIITKSEIIIGEVPVWDCSSGQFYPDEQYATITEHVICNEDEVADIIAESEDVILQIVCDYYKTVNNNDIYRYKKTNRYYCVCDNKLYKVSSRNRGEHNDN